MTAAVVTLGEQMREASPGTPAGWRPSWGVPPLFATPRTFERPTFGPVVAEVAARLGRPLMPHQRYVADVLGEVQSVEAGDPEPGRLAYDDGLVLMPRRSGKTVVVQPMTARVCGGPVKATAWTMAQSRDAAKRRWMDASDGLVEKLGRAVRRKVSNSHEELRWVATGSVFRPVAPNDEAMHGEEPAMVTVDELWTLTLAELAAIEDGFRPSWLVADGQSVKLSAAGVLRSSALKRERIRGREAVLRGSRLGLAMFEWALPDRIGGQLVAELSDRDLLDAVLAMHPRTLFGLRRQFLEAELAKGRARFLRHFGGHDDDSAGQSAAIHLGKLAEAAAVETIPDDARVVLAVDVDPDGLEATITAGVRMPDGYALVEVVEQRAGVRWAGPALLDRLLEGPVGLVAVGAARDLADEVAPYLAEAGVDLLRVPAADQYAAASRLKSMIEQQDASDAASVRILDPAGAVERAAMVAGVVRYRSGAAFVRVGDDPVTALPAAAIALWSIDKIPAPPAPVRPFKIL